MDRQTPMEILPCPKLCLRVVKIQVGEHFSPLTKNDTILPNELLLFAKCGQQNIAFQTYVLIEICKE